MKAGHSAACQASGGTKAIVLGWHSDSVLHFSFTKRGLCQVLSLMKAGG